MARRRSMGQVLQDVTNPKDDTLTRRAPSAEQRTNQPTLLHYAPPAAPKTTMLPTEGREESMSEEVYLTTQRQVDALFARVEREVTETLPGLEPVALSAQDRHNILKASLLNRGVDDATYFTVKAKALGKARSALATEALDVRNRTASGQPHTPKHGAAHETLSSPEELAGYLNTLESAIAVLTGEIDRTVTDLRTWLQSSTVNAPERPAAHRMQRDSLLAVLNSVN